MAMVGESTALAMVWTSISGWLTPTFFFLLLNVVIGTIALTSKSHRRDHPTVLERMRSFNFNPYRYRSDELPLETAVLPPSTTAVLPPSTTTLPPPPTTAVLPPPTTTALLPHPTTTAVLPPPTTATVHVEKKKEEEEVVAETLEDAYKNFKTNKTDPAPVPEERIGKGGRGPAKKASNKAGKPEEEEEAKEVDDMADDFINRFRKQLQLQRLESLLRNRRSNN